MSPEKFDVFSLGMTVLFVATDIKSTDLKNVKKDRDLYQ